VGVTSKFASKSASKFASKFAGAGIVEVPVAEVIAVEVIMMRTV
jgi:hypothetical protein